MMHRGKWGNAFSPIMAKRAPQRDCCASLQQIWSGSRGFVPSRLDGRRLATARLARGFRPLVHVRSPWVLY